MSEHRATIDWQLGEREFTYETYSRDHRWRFESGVETAASSAPQFGGTPERVDPEETLVAAISSCHMLTLLAVAARKRMKVRSYHDSAVGFLEPNEEGKLAVTRVELRPRIEFDGEPPGADKIERLHQSAHRNCFIANSVKTEVTVIPE
jgi:organic hydroperoxide reductase OsmC/OhrA